MKANNAKILIAGAAMAGLLGGTATRVHAAQLDLSKTVIGTHAGLLAADATPGKHDCKGKNACKGQGGCKSSDNGCKGKNSCKERAVAAVRKVSVMQRGGSWEFLNSLALSLQS